MGSFYIIPFRPPFKTDVITFSRAEVSEQFPFPLVRIVYLETEIGKQEAGMRLDVDKQTFIDHLDDDAKESSAQQLAPVISAYVVHNMRTGRRNP